MACKVTVLQGAQGTRGRLEDRARDEDWNNV